MPAREVHLVAAAADAGDRLDRFLASRLPDLSRSAIQRLIAEGHVQVSSGKVKPGLRIEPPAMIAPVATTGTMTVVGAGETVLAFTGVGGLSMLLPGAAILLILGMMLLVFARREEPDAQ